MASEVQTQELILYDKNWRFCSLNLIILEKNNNFQFFC